MPRITNHRRAELFGRSVHLMTKGGLWFGPHGTDARPTAVPLDVIARRSREAATYGRKALRYQRTKARRKG